MNSEQTELRRHFNCWWCPWKTRPVHDADRAGVEVRRVLNGNRHWCSARSTRFDFTGHQDARNGWLWSLLIAQSTTFSLSDSGNFLARLDEVLDKVKAFSVGGVDYISKPFQFEEVFVRIESTDNPERRHFKRRFASLNYGRNHPQDSSPWSWANSQTTVTEVQKILQTDRAVIYHFYQLVGKFVWKL